MTRLRSNKDFVRLFFGRIVTNAGDSMYFIASMWLVYTMTGSPFYTGLAGFLIRIPQGMGFLAGPLVDRWALRSVLVKTQLIQGLCVLIIPAAAYFDVLSVWIILIVMPILSFLNQLVYPAQAAALPRIVSDDQLVRANSMFGVSLRGIDMTFNALGGILVATIGAVSIFIIDSITFFLATLIFMGLSISNPNAKEDGDDASEEETGTEEAVEEKGRVEEYLEQLKGGFWYLKGSVLPKMIAGGLIVNFVFGGLIAVLPAFADTYTGASAYGFLMAAASAGTVLGALGASAIDDYPFGKIVIAGYAASAVFWFAALSFPGIVAASFFFFLAFIPIGVVNVVVPSMVQSVVEDEYMARVMSIVSSAGIVALPIGSLIGGAVGSWVGVGAVMMSMVFALAFLSLYFLIHPQLRVLPAVGDADKKALGL